MEHAKGRGAQEPRFADVKTQHPMMQWVKDRWLTVLIVVVFLIIWEALGALGWIKVLFFPPPSRILSAIGYQLTSGDLIDHAAMTLIRVSQGFLLGAVPGLLIGLIMGWLPAFRKIIDPLVAAFHSVPKIAMFPLALVVFGIGEAPKIVLIGVSCFFPMLISTMTGVRQISPVYYEIAQNYGARGIQVITNVLIPASVPEVLTGVRLSLNTALIIAIALEMIASNNGLGELIWLAWQTMHVDRLYATLFATAFIGMVANGITQGLATLISPWRDQD